VAVAIVVVFVIIYLVQYFRLWSFSFTFFTLCKFHHLMLIVPTKCRMSILQRRLSA